MAEPFQDIVKRITGASITFKDSPGVFRETKSLHDISYKSTDDTITYYRKIDALPNYIQYTGGLHFFYAYLFLVSDKFKRYTANSKKDFADVYAIYTLQKQKVVSDIPWDTRDKALHISPEIAATSAKAYGYNCIFLTMDGKRLAPGTENATLINGDTDVLLFSVDTDRYYPIGYTKGTASTLRFKLKNPTLEPVISILQKAIEEDKALAAAAAPAEVNLSSSLQSLHISPDASPPDASQRKGISNVGNSCYMNAMLQLLYSIDELRTTILTVNIPPLTQDTAMLQRSGNPVSRSMSLDGYKNILLALKTIFTTLSGSSSKSIPNPVYDTLRKVNPDFGNRTQEDSAELFRGILPILRSFYTDPKILRTLRAMSYYETSTVTCANGSQSVTNELLENSTYETLSTFMKMVDRDSVLAKSIPDKQFPIILNNAVKFSLDLNIVDETSKPLTSVQAAIDAYTKLETVNETENKVAACTDKGSVARTKQLSLHSSLYTKWHILTLKRFEPSLDSKGAYITDRQGNPTFTKNSKPITISPTIQIDGDRFEIQGLILHIGRTTRSGHYIYIIYEGGNPRRVLNDTENIPITQAYSSMIPTDSYILLYKK